MKPRIGFIGLGKLGLPVALAIDSKDYNVIGYDINPDVSNYLERREIPYREEGASELLAKHQIEFGTMQQVVEFSDIIFVPVQTPHEERFEGITPIPLEREDFNYTFLINAIKDLADVIAAQPDIKNVVIISTVLPGTIEEHIKPLLNDKMILSYNPYFIAMGTTIKDFLNPEFVLLGIDSHLEKSWIVTQFYNHIHKKKVYRTSIKNAELIKVAYNTFISMKIAYTNTIMEICHHTGADIDQVMTAIGLAKERLISPKYLQGGMGDGGGCHPRDNIAMSWLARKLDLSHDFFEDIMFAREDQTAWLAKIIHDTAKEHNLPIVIMGIAFKEQTNLTVGSPALLLIHYLKEWGHNPRVHDPYVAGTTPHRKERAVYFIATRHEEFVKYGYDIGSVVIDPWRYLDSDKIKRENCLYIPIGKPT